MHIWSSLVGREAGFLTVLMLLGAGPASLLSDRFDAAGRIGLAPALGFCLGTCVTTTLLEFAPVNATYWILLPVALGSAATAIQRTRRSSRRTGRRARLPGRDLAALVLIGLAVTGPINATLHSHGTVGPAAFTYTDGDNYVAVQDAARTVSLGRAVQRWNDRARAGAPWPDYTQFIWSYFAQFGSNLDATPLDANVNALLDLGATDSFAPFLSVLLLVGGLGAFAAVRYYACSATALAPLAGCLFGGALFLELYFDTYQAATIALGLIVPFAVLLDQALVDPRRSVLVLLSLMLATLLTVYPLYVPLLLVAAAAIVLAQAIALRRRGVPLRPLGRPVALAALAVGGLAVLLDPVAVARDVHYYQLVLHNQIELPRVGFTLPVQVLPGWIAQTREFWVLPELGSGGIKQIALGVLLPLLFIAFVVLGLRRHPRALALVVIAAVAAGLAESTYVSQQSCTYCAERDLLTLAPIVAVLLPLGLGAALAAPARWVKLAGLATLALAVTGVAQRVRVELTRFSDQSYFLDSGNRHVLDHLPAGGGRVNLEGFGASVAAQAEQPLVYHYLNWRAPGRVSFIAGSDLGNSIDYLDFGAVRLPPGPEFDPRYRYVLTRLAGVSTDRRLIAREGTVALEQRVSPLDVTPYAGLSAALGALDPGGVAWVQAPTPLQMYVVGTDGGRPAWARLTFRVGTPVSVSRQPGVRSALNGATLTVCVRARGREPIRAANLVLSAALAPGRPPAELYPPAMPLEGVALTAMYAVTGGCSVRASGPAAVS